MGSGLVEIAALTTIIGGTTAESLILGSRGAAGLPWATMSCFGMPLVLRGCITASTPLWLREALGLSTGVSDSITGLRSKKIATSTRPILGVAAGVGSSRSPFTGCMTTVAC